MPKALSPIKIPSRGQTVAGLSRVANVLEQSIVAATDGPQTKSMVGNDEKPHLRKHESFGAVCRTANT